jgi:2-C-methyl-D-erythritol 2,4-cyclodiphosphate synthase
MVHHFRIGIGYDIHVLEEGYPLVLGGIVVDSKKGARSHSDGDCLLHALCDALLGAAGLPDIGCLFPDDDENYRNRSSEHFVLEVLRRLRILDLAVVNVDANVLLEHPKISPHAPSIRDNIGRMLQIHRDCVNVKGRTNECQDSVGRGLAVAAQVVCLLSSSPDPKH